MKEYMIIPTYDTVILPDVDYQLGVGELSDGERSRIKIDGGKAIFLPLKNPTERSEMTLDSFHTFGVLADILEIKDTPIMGTRIHAQTRGKVEVTAVSRAGEILEGSFVAKEEFPDITEAGEKKMLDALKKSSIELASHIQGGALAISYIQNVKSINEYGAMFCQFFDMTADEKYALLATDSLRQRGLAMQDALLKFKGTVDLQADLNKRYNDTEGNVYKKAAIQKQIGLLQQELDDMDPEAASEESEYRKKIDAAGMPEDAKREIERALKRYQMAQPNDPERATLENYLDFVTALAWQPEELPAIDLAAARKVLDRDHYGMDKVKERILQQMAVMELKDRQAGSILLLVGAPGTGKTSIGRGIAEALGRKYVRISLGGVHDESDIRGHRRTYIGAMPGRIMDGIKRSGAMNPVVVLDEVDKLSASLQGDPSSALLEVLDPEQNSTFQDHYMNVPYDLSKVFFICTANTTDTIPQPLLDRCEVIQLSGYTPIEKLQIAKRHLLPRAMEDTGITKKDLAISDAALRAIIEKYTMEAGVRGLKKQLDTLCRHAAAAFVESGRKKISVKESDLPTYLGTKSIRHDHAQKKNPPGVVTGLAWTQVGGEILFIETSFMPGTGKVIITGQLGDVMKESATISTSLVRSLFPDEKLDFKDKDIHIHVPSGAVPKDGPSAGITMLTALVSLVTKTPAPANLAMTGELSLSGRVLPIGGLPEKLMAADRAGIKRVLIPKDNVRDLDDVPEEVRGKLTIVPVDSAKEVIRQALGLNGDVTL